MGWGTCRAAGAGLIAFGVFAVYAGWGQLLQDEGWLLDAASRVASGEVPYADFRTAYPPGRYYLAAAVMEAVGPDVVAVRLTLAALRAVVVSLVFLLTARIASRSAAVLAAATAALLPGAWHKVFFPLVALAPLVPASLWEERRRPGLLLTAGAIAGLGAWFRQDAALAGALGAAAVVLLAARARTASPARDLALLGAATVVAGSVPFVFFAAHGVTPVEILRQSVVEAIPIADPHPQVVRNALRFDLAGRPFPHGHVLAALVWSVPAVSALAALAAWRARRSGRSGLATLGGIGIAGLLLCHQAFRPDSLIRFLQCGPLVFPAFYALAERSRARIRRPFLAVPAAMAAYVLFADGNRVQPVEFTGTLAVRLQGSQELEVRGRTLHVPPSQAALGDLAAYIRTTTQPDEPILVLGEPAPLYFLTGRRNPTTRIRFAEMHVGELDAVFWDHVRSEGCRLFVLPDTWADRFPSRLPPGADRRLLGRFGNYTVWEMQPA